jgi:hypothetical protein
MPRDFASLKPTWLRAASLALFGLALLILVGYLAIYVNYAAALFRFPFDYDQGEGFELTDTIIHSQGGWPYRDNEQFPFYASNYPPLFHIMVVPLVWLSGPHYWTGRLVSFVGTLVTASAIGYAVYRDGRRNWIVAGLAGLAFLASNYVYHVGPLFRQHMTMVMFETLAVVTLASVDRGLPRRLWVGLALLLAAGYTKQLALATCVAVFGWLALRGVKRAVVAGLIFAAVAGVLFVAINAATDGYWYLNIIAANVNLYIVTQAIELFQQWFRLHAVLIVLAAGLALWELYRERLSLYSVWFALGLVNGALAGKWGAGESYFATSIAAACILAGIAVSRLIGLAAVRREVWAHGLAIALPVALIVQGGLMLHMPTEGPIFGALARALGVPPEVVYIDTTGYTQLGRPPTEADIEAGKRIAAYVAEGDAPALSEEAGFSLYADKPVVTNPTQLLNLYNNGLFDPGPLAEMIEAQAFNVVILRASFYPEPVLVAIHGSYRGVDEVKMNGFTYVIMKPRAQE